MPFPPPHPAGTGVIADITLPIWAALLIFAGIALFFTVMFVRALRRRQTIGLWFIYLFMLASMVLCFFEATTKDFEARLFRYMTATIGLHGTQLLVAVLVVIIGFCAHKFKQANKLWYGCSEITFGTVSAVLIVTRVNFAAVEFRALSLAQCAALIGAAYVVARGLNNVGEAMRGEPQQRITAGSARYKYSASIPTTRFARFWSTSGKRAVFVSKLEPRRARIRWTNLL